MVLVYHDGAVFPLRFWCVSVCPKNQWFWYA